MLENAGFEVTVPKGHFCCGRPLYDYGMLDLAKDYLRGIMLKLRPQIEAGIPFVVLEPSCASVFRDELHGLFPDEPLAEKLRKQTFLFSEFLEQRAQNYELPQLPRKALVQGHCHQKSILNFDSEKSVLKKMGLNAAIPPTGCCGMAGSFGFEKDKYGISVAVGERMLLPAVRQAPLSTMVLADGFSCREQIKQQTGRRGLHLAEVIDMASKGEQQFPFIYPEAKITATLNAARRRSRWRAAGILAAIAAAGLALAGYAITGSKH